MVFFPQLILGRLQDTSNGQKQTTLSIFARHKAQIQYLLLWKRFLTIINKEIY
jgi:hypothetical protein